MTAGFYSALPPARAGVADYSAGLLRCDGLAWPRKRSAPALAIARAPAECVVGRVPA